MENAGSNAALMRRIVQLEKERDELQKDVEAMCLQQAGVASSVDVSTRMQARRATSLEQELDSCKEKTTLLTRENHNLQEELSEAYRLKSHLTEAFKRAVEKSNQLEKEVKFYQSKVAAAFAERDKAIVEVERVHEVEKAMTAKVQQFHNRAEEAENQCKEHDTRLLELQNQLDILYKVVDKFWGARENVLATDDNGQLQHIEPLDKATALLSDSDGRWAYGGCNREAEEALRQELKDAQILAEENGLVAKQEQSRANELDAQLAKLKEKVEATTHSLQTQLEEKQHLQQLAAEKASTYEMQLGKLEKFTISKVLEVQADHEDVRARVDSLLEDEKQWIDSMIVSFEALLLELKASEAHPEIVDKYEERGPPQEETSVPEAEPSGPDGLEEDPLPEAEPSRAGDLEENLLLENELSRTVDIEEPITSEDTAEVEETTLPSHDQNVPESVCSESSPRPDISVVVSASSSVQPESIAGPHPVAENDDNRLNEEEPFSAVLTLSKRATDMDEESRKVLAQALQEKVEALLLLSQQEERYYLESKTVQGLEFQIKDLNEKITQVSRDKVTALMEVAQLRQDCLRLEEREKELIRRLQQHRSTSAGGRLLPASWSEPNASQEKSNVVTEKQLIVPKPITTGGYLKSWLRGMDLSGPGSSMAASGPTKQSGGTNTSKNTQTEEPVDLAKLRVENAALQERVAGVQRLTESAHRLRMTLLKVSTDSETQQSVKSLNLALETVEGVKREASHLRVALTCSLPVSVTPESPLSQSKESRFSSGEGMSNSSDGEVHTAVDVATGAGIEMVELLLAACEVQKSGLQRQIDILALQCKDPGSE
ncbi:hypothetical protein KC19_9G114300 [Ceratodon purpureus]|uniref:Uncharacterized protein n=1 Tax=Ceratodon purpureus TaxID=3225 RepID=A0A8T0GQZ8_CERPU|nr:hypothetical protein KC19_9G114300 [Ceratodon purpureus]